MKILVTGANGMLGQDLCPILQDEGFDVIETDINNLNITNKNEAQNFISLEKPDMVIHCAAYTNVDKAEEDFENALLINKTGTYNIACACKKNDIPLIYISTDYVFDGEKDGKYLNSDIPNPQNVYGISKLEGEKAVQLLLDKFYILRTSWLYGHHGKNFVETMISLKDKEELKVVDDQKGCPTWTVELANAIVEIIREEFPFGIYHVCGTGETTWFGFAKKIFELLNYNVNLKPCTTKEFERKAKRPKNSTMENNGICRNWESALKDYIELRCE